ncbi:MAG: YicC family protein [Gemmatimonadales bacterium]|jgi:uncharacterized protein (TIGR00255 family)|nr:MAG: YicC family protein [Gemmatimonadales bacterium]
MIRSMTGFGEAEREVSGGLLRVSIKTVNHRFLNTSVRTPPGFDRLEHEIPGWIRPFLLRGHASVSVSLERTDASEDENLPDVDMARAGAYTRLLRTMQEELGLDGPVDVGTVARFPEVLTAPERRAQGPSVEAAELKAVVEDAAQAVLALRETEGARLEEDLTGRLDELTRLLDVVEARAPERLVAERDRLRAHIRDLVDSEEVDEERLMREVAYVAEKWDINEEIVRFRSHVALFRETLDTEAMEAVGKRLSFIVQEMHREANTIGAKANDSEISHASVGMKEEIERLREQVENVE